MGTRVIGCAPVSLSIAGAAQVAGYGSALAAVPALNIGGVAGAAAALLASYLPARRALAVDPVETMRAE